MTMPTGTTTLLGALPSAGGASRRLGRFELRRLLARSSRTMWWAAHESSTAAMHWLALPRRLPSSPEALARWLRDARHLARLSHPQLLPVAHAGVESGWPFVASVALEGETLEAHLLHHPPPAPEQTVQWMCDMLQGLAYLHEAGLAHGDIAAYSVLLDAQGRALLMPGGLIESAAVETAPVHGGLAIDADALRVQRDASALDLRACGLLLHRLLGGAPALDEMDPPTSVERADREIVRLGWATPQPIPDALRAICNRATEREPLRRYLSARSLQRALQGWLDAQAEGGGVISQVIDRLHGAGHLPALPGLLLRLAQLTALEQQGIGDIADLVVQDPAFAFELLRHVNAVQFAAHSDGGVTTVRRAIALVGVQGLRHTAKGLRPWPGALEPPAVPALAAALRDALLSAEVARSLCPADMDGEGVYLIALLQHLGPLLARYHLHDEAEQIQNLVHPGPSVARGMTESAAACCVLGVDLETLGVAVARHWGLDERMLFAMRRISLEAPVRAPDDRHDMRRLLASAACEAVATLSSREARSGHAAAALARVAQRYARALVLAPGELAAALQAALQTVDSPGAPSPSA
jgi:non-specific serine/threonine protein kinase